MKRSIILFLLCFIFTNLYAAPPFNEEILGGLNFIKRLALTLDGRIKANPKNKEKPKVLYSDSFAAIIVALHKDIEASNTEKKPADIGDAPSEAERDYESYLKNISLFVPYIESNLERINKATDQQARNKAVFGNDTINDISKLMGRSGVCYPEETTKFSGEIKASSSNGGELKEGELVNFVLSLNPESAEQVTQASRKAIDSTQELKDLGMEISTVTGTENKNMRRITLGLREQFESKEEVEKRVENLNKNKSELSFNTQGELKVVVPDDIRVEQIAFSRLDDESLGKLSALRSQLTELTSGGNEIAPFCLSQAVKKIKPDENALDKFLENTTHKDALNNYLTDIDFPIALEEIKEESN
jgi:hypothetical protein